MPPVTKPVTGARTGNALDRLSPPAKAGVGLLFCAMVAALYFVVFYGDIATEISSEQQRETSLQGELQQAKASKEAYQKDLDEKTRREQLAREQRKVLPDESETPAFLSAVQSIATIAGVNLTSWSPLEESVQEFYAKVPMKLTLSGKFHQVAKFFHGVGQLNRIINIEDIQIKAAHGKGEKDKDDVEVEIEVECLATAFRAVKTGEGSKRRGAGH